MFSIIGIIITHNSFCLQEIGLKSLLKILRGSVRIEKNPALCFVETIEWSLITSGSKENVFSNNKAVNECPTCPNGLSDKNMIGGPQIGTGTLLNCPEVDKKRICWNRSTCQRGESHIFFSILDSILNQTMILFLFTQNSLR